MQCTALHCTEAGLLILRAAQGALVLILNRPLGGLPGGGTMWRGRSTQPYAAARTSWVDTLPDANGVQDWPAILSACERLGC